MMKINKKMKERKKENKKLEKRNYIKLTQE